MITNLIENVGIINSWTTRKLCNT